MFVLICDDDRECSLQLGEQSAAVISYILQWRMFIQMYVWYRVKESSIIGAV